MNDIYSKAVMTVIAVALTVIAGNQLFGPASALGDGCGGIENPCLVEAGTPFGIDVHVINWP